MTQPPHRRQLRGARGIARRWHIDLLIPRQDPVGNSEVMNLG